MKMIWFIDTFLKLCLFEREKKRESVCMRLWGGRGRGREKFKHTPCLWGALGRARSNNPEIMTWAEIQNQPLNQLSHPGTPVWLFNLKLGILYSVTCNLLFLSLLCFWDSSLLTHVALVHLCFLFKNHFLKFHKNILCLCHFLKYANILKS